MGADSPIAIVGLSYRAPGVGRKGLFEYLADAKSAFTRVPADRFDQDAFYNPDHHKAGCFSSKGGHFLPDDVYSFDASFFGLRAEESRATDPHHRMILECAWEAAESAGLTLQDLAGSNTGVFSALGVPEHGQQVTGDLPSSSAWSCVGDGHCMHANRVSYFFDLNGPSITLDAACASGAHAVHHACQSLRAGECKSAFVAAAHLILGPNEWILLDTMGTLSPEGRCFSYDSKASGFGRGEGAACLLVKRLEDAIADGDPIHAVIRNTACNHSGRSEGITMPSRAAQERLLLRVHNDIGLSPSETPIVEGHGTGTQVGDPIEAGAFSTVLGSHRTSSDPLYIGSVKSNFGHLEGASGVIGMIKAILMLKNDCILPNAGFQELNKKIDGGDKLRVAQTTLPWPTNAVKRVVVTSFGFGGSNVAIVLEKAPPAEHRPGSLINGVSHHTDNDTLLNGKITNGTDQTGDKLLTNGNACNSNGSRGGDTLPNGNVANEVTGEQRLFVFSAKSETSLTSYLSSFVEYLEANSKSSQLLRNLSYTLGQRRTHLPHRVAVTANSASALKSQLLVSKATRRKNQRIAFVFTGQGAQHARMAADLRRFKVFATAIDEADAYIKEFGASWSLKDELDKPESETRVNDAEISQPACTAIQIALVALLKLWGILPTVVTGHSSGEIGAAFAAGIVSFKAAIAIAYFRGQAAAQLAQASTRKGGMLALGVSAEEASALLGQLDQGADDYATIAAINSPQSVTISGNNSTVDEVKQIADAKGLFARKLNIQVAYHSRHMEQVAESYLASIKPFCDADVELRSKKTARPVFVSSVTGSTADSDAVDASYWVKNLVQPVRFSDAISSVYAPQGKNITEEKSIERQIDIAMEIGPHSALKTPITQTIEWVRQRKNDQTQPRISYLPSLVRGKNGDDTLITTAGTLFSMGFDINLAAVNQTDRHNACVLADLPSYAWDKSVRYVLKSWVTQQKLHPGQSYDPLIGWRTSQSVGSDHVFSQVFTLDEMPWIRDHNLGGHAVFPMTGYLSAAIEAVRRVSSISASTILLRECYFKSPLLIDEDEQVFLVTKLTPAVTGTETRSSTVWSFEILSWHATTAWTTHCYGQAEPEIVDMSINSAAFSSLLPLIHSKDMADVEVEHEYTTQEQNGMRFGPEFRSMKKLSIGKGWTVIETQMRDLDRSLPSSFGSRVAVDPPTMDSFIHGAGPLATESSGRRVAWMPIHISRLRVSNKIPDANGQRFMSVSRLQSLNSTAGMLSFSTVAFALGADDSLMPIVEYESMSYRPTASSDSVDLAARLPWSLYWDYIPSLDSANEDVIAQTLQLETITDDDLRNRRARLNDAAVYYLDRALRETAEHDFSSAPSHLSRFRDWSKTIVSQHKLISESEVPTLLTKVANTDAQGQMLCSVGESLPAFLRSEMEPLEVMLKDGLLTKHYESDKDNLRSSRVLAKFAGHLSDTKPDMRVLEIGGGTGSATRPVLEELSAHGTRGSPAFVHYTFTDISSGFFDNARSKLAQWAQRITYKRLDISQDPLQQGFVGEAYDLIIASNVLHATPNIGATLDHVRSLLKPYGKLLLLEVVQTLPLALPFVLLPGWWLSEDEYRTCEEGPLLSEEAWNRLLTDRGFSGVNTRIPDSRGTSDETLLSVMCSTRVGKAEDRHETAPITISGLLYDDEELEFAEIVAEQVGQLLGCAVSVKPFSELDATDDQYCIVIDSPRRSLLDSVSSETFVSLKTMLLETTGILWVVPDGCPPEAETIKGILRTLRLEDGSRSLLLLENSPCTSLGASTIAKVAERLRDRESVSRVDNDFVWRDGMIQLPRLRQDTAVRDIFASEDGLPVRRKQSLWQHNSAFEMTMDTAGSLESTYFRRTDVLSRKLGPDEVLIKIDAAGVNFRDLLVVLNSVPGVGLGGEAAGVILQAGDSVSDLKPGDRVFFVAVGGGSFATHYSLESWRAIKIPEGITNPEAASMPVAYLTALVAIQRIARLTKGEKILIHAGSGAVGQACIVLAQHLGADIYATAGTPTKREFLHKTFNIPQTHIFSSRTPDFREGILGATQGYGVDVVINCLSGNLLQESWNLVADFGRFVEIGKKDFLQNSNLGMRPFNRNVTFSGVDASTLFGQRPEELRKCLKDFVELLQDKVIVPIQPVTTLPISEFGTAIRKLQAGQNIGKLVVTLGADASELAECVPGLQVPSTGLLSHDATYLITGGTGGIGLSLASWMVENGAQNVILLGRSGSSRPEVKKVLDAHSGKNVCMRAIACDVGSRASLMDALEQIKDLPPVRGVVHGALFLNDALLVNASYEDWQNVTTPRIQGAQYLDELLPNVDFFIMLSSMLGATGNIGQTIYAGTANFFDAFADARRARGLPATSIALPVVLDVGFVADRGLTETLKSSLGVVLSEPHVKTLVKGAVLGSNSGLSHNGRSMSFSFASGDDRAAPPWRYLHPQAFMKYINSQKDKTENDGSGQIDGKGSVELKHANDVTLLDALITRVSWITMVERSEVEPDVPLATYSLDSLISLELRNWIRRETGVDLSLPKIVGSENLRALATTILAQRG